MQNLISTSDLEHRYRTFNFLVPRLTTFGVVLAILCRGLGLRANLDGFVERMARRATALRDSAQLSDGRFTSAG